MVFRNFCFIIFEGLHPCPSAAPTPWLRSCDRTFAAMVYAAIWVVDIRYRQRYSTNNTDFVKPDFLVNQVDDCQPVSS